MALLSHVAFTGLKETASRCMVEVTVLTRLALVQQIISTRLRILVAARGGPSWLAPRSWGCRPSPPARLAPVRSASWGTGSCVGSPRAIRTFFPLSFPFSLGGRSTVSVSGCTPSSTRAFLSLVMSESAPVPSRAGAELHPCSTVLLSGFRRRTSGSRGPVSLKVPFTGNVLCTLKVIISLNGLLLDIII